ncbi:uncharacterized protein LOC113504771 [Trichoplusia ni]|uniref:Uncharacterized protein LOC113504771 n=1 Tax=Trichoplusia ni TaxID=7111 RepID=A0A7E5WS73_TRINI|nr:uncharacterized protein LOC113504771 [Trichoplusia ni]
MRLLTILLVTRAVAEWVEISQHHYRKPIRTHSPFTTPKAISTEETAKPWNYNNHSVTEYNWSKTPSRSSNVANIKRVEHGHAVRTTETTLLQSEDIDFDTSDRRHHHRPTEAPVALKVKQKGTIERVPNIGNVKRVQLNESPVKSQSVRVKGGDGNVSTNHMRIYFTDDPRKTENNFEDKENLETLRRIYVNEVKKGHITEKTFLYTTENVEDFSFDAPETETKVTPPTQGSQNSDESASTEISYENKVSSGNKENYEQSLGLDHENTKQPDKRPENNKSKPDEAKHKVANNTKTEKNKINGIENVLKFMAVVAESISKNSRKSFGGKVSYLQDLKDSILATIEDRIDETWPDEDGAGTRRHSRSAHASPRGHVHIPSSESALMTISFLTFAVFLIKLVLVSIAQGQASPIAKVHYLLKKTVSFLFSASDTHV